MADSWYESWQRRSLRFVGSVTFKLKTGGKRKAGWDLLCSQNRKKAIVTVVRVTTGRERGPGAGKGRGIEGLRAAEKINNTIRDTGGHCTESDMCRWAFYKGWGRCIEKQMARRYKEEHLRCSCSSAMMVAWTAVVTMETEDSQHK